MKEALIICTLNNGKHSTWVFNEIHSENDYGNGNYISIVRGTHHEAYVDVRYSKTYNFKSWCENYIRMYYGVNLDKYATIVRDTI
jgi:hypothetical protein